MASGFYLPWKENLVKGVAGNFLNGTLKAALVDAGTYTFSSAHQFRSSLSGVIGTPGALASRTYTNGVLDAADTVYTAVSGASIEAVVLYIDNGSAATDVLVAYIELTAPVTPTGADITVVWNASGIFAL